MTYKYDWYNSATVTVDINEDKKNEIIEELLTYFDEHSCWRGEALCQNDDGFYLLCRFLDTEFLASYGTKNIYQRLRKQNRGQGSCNVD